MVWQRFRNFVQSQVCGFETRLKYLFSMKKDIILAGVGGQGILTIAKVIGIAALDLGLHLKQAEVHGMSQRGGDVQSGLRLSSDTIYSDLIPLGCADLIISMEPMEALRYLPFLAPTGQIVTNSVPLVNINDYPATEALDEEFDALGDKVTAFDSEEMAREAGSPRSANIVLLGAAAPYLDIDVDTLRQCVARRFADKGEAVAAANVAAFNAGLSVSLSRD